MTLYKDDGGVWYTVRHVPLDEAINLSNKGIVFFDYTKLTAVNTCPTYGTMRYAQHKTEAPMGGRSMAIECGKACHDFFAALRMWTLVDRFPAHPSVLTHGAKLFGTDRWLSMMSVAQDGDRHDNAIRFALEALHSSGFYDDPYERRRTMQNMEVSCITYANRYLQSDMPVHVREDFIGVEVPFVVEVTRRVKGYDHQHRAYYCGRIDGVHDYGNTIIAAENKTASRLDTHWRNMFHMSNQVTGYCIALSAMLGIEVSEAQVMGAQIPVPVRDMHAGVSFEPVSRSISDKIRWCEWFFHSIQMYEKFQDDPTNAPRYTHSCNRYFSTCQFLPFCTASRDEQKEMLATMAVDVWSPLDHLKTPEPVGE